MKNLKKRLPGIFLLLSIILNIILVIMVSSPKDYERNIVGYYEGAGLGYNFFEDGTLRISDDESYVETKYDKVDKNMYTYKIDEKLNLIFRQDYSFYVFYSDTGYVGELEKISSQTMTIGHLKEKENFN